MGKPHLNVFCLKVYSVWLLHDRLLLYDV